MAEAIYRRQSGIAALAGSCGHQRRPSVEHRSWTVSRSNLDGVRLVRPLVGPSLTAKGLRPVWPCAPVPNGLAASASHNILNPATHSFARRGLRAGRLFSAEVDLNGQWLQSLPTRRNCHEEPGDAVTDGGPIEEGAQSLRREAPALLRRVDPAGRLEPASFIRRAVEADRPDHPPDSAGLAADDRAAEPGKATGLGRLPCKVELDEVARVGRQPPADPCPDLRLGRDGVTRQHRENEMGRQRHELEVRSPDRLTRDLGRHCASELTRGHLPPCAQGTSIPTSTHGSSKLKPLDVRVQAMRACGLLSIAGWTMSERGVSR